MRHLLTAAPAPEVRVNAPAMYREAAERQTRRTRTWRRFALAACAAVFALLAVTALARLEIHVGSSEIVVRWGPAPDATSGRSRSRLAGAASRRATCPPLKIAYAS